MIGIDSEYEYIAYIFNQHIPSPHHRGGDFCTYKSVSYDIFENFLGDKTSCRPNYFVPIYSLNSLNLFIN